MPVLKRNFLSTKTVNDISIHELVSSKIKLGVWIKVYNCGLPLEMARLLPARSDKQSGAFTYGV